MSSPLPGGFPSSIAGTPHSSSLPTSRPIVDPLAFDNVRGLRGSLPGPDEAEEEGVVRRGGAGPMARREDQADVPRVKDATGEKVMESFALFLERRVSDIASPFQWSDIQLYRAHRTA